MKIRSDFVSNSSSSSFMVIGNMYKMPEIYEIIKQRWSKFEEKCRMYHKPSPSSSYVAKVDWCVFLLEQFLFDSGSGLISEQGISNFSYDQFCVGMKFEQMKDNETKKEFLTRIQDTLQKVLGKSYLPKTLKDGGYVG